MHARIPKIACLFVGIGILAADSSSETSSQYMRLFEKKGYKSKDMLELGKKGLVASNGERLPGCSMEDNLSLNEKYLLADAVVIGEISSTTYLYKEGGPFRTKFRIKIAETLKGENLPEFVEVVSPFGPNSKDHRRWRRHPLRVDLETGDKGLFLLESGTIKQLQSEHPDHASEIEGKFVFLFNQLKGSYLYKNNDFDPEFSTALSRKHAGKAESAKTNFKKIDAILTEGSKK